MLLCRNFGIGKHYALFGVRYFLLKFGWCKENDIFPVCFHADGGCFMKGEVSAPTAPGLSIVVSRLRMFW